MRETKKNIYDDISTEILDYLTNNEIKYNLESENKQIENKIAESFDKDKDEVEIFERFQLRVIYLLNYLEKIVQTTAKKVYISKYLSKKINSGELTQDVINQIDEFKKKFEIGEDIKSNLSKGVFNSNSWDYLLNIWNIRHLHLSKSVRFEKNEMSKNRSNYLLFFVLHKDNVYFIDAKEHPKGSGFTPYKFLEILEESSWLELIGFYEMEGFTNLSPNIKNDDDIYNLTKLNINTGFELKGKCYMNIGGVSSFGNKNHHTQILMKLIEEIDEIDKVLEYHKLDYVKFKLLLDKRLGIIKVKINSEEKEFSLMKLLDGVWIR
ncbi:hypothetical protein M4I33_15695 [Clostridium sp. LY3-2]|uniref:hypothetical protein n=1 Tax=Clostridium sp. LY3-2 TaxID=2942482 RepID=UPI002153335F|nr:hypothetical protein [Clostridium sp. LY3-2]MCR6516308.1 hypothetical protein [Clostridium sp. LY3-2]